MVLAKPKKGAARAEQRARRRELERYDKSYNAAVFERARNRCEARIAFGDFLEPRCNLPGYEVHHCLGGTGRRGREESALPENKLLLCEIHHRMLHGTPCRIVQAGAPGGPWWFRRVS